METDQLSPEKSFELITRVIAQARERFEENGFIYLFWGALIAIAAFSQFLLLRGGMHSQSWYPYLLMPVGSIFTWLYFSKKKRGAAPNRIASILTYSWVILSLNLMILGFLFWAVLEQNLIPILLILMSLGVVISGLSIRSLILIASGLIMNICAFISFAIEWMYQPFLLGLIAVIAVFLPGVFLMMKHKRRGDVSRA